VILTSETGEAVPGAVQTLANQILIALDKAYPSFTDKNNNTSWNLKIDTQGGIIQLTNSLISGRMGVQLPISWLDPEMRLIVQYAGELLERYCVSRDKHINVEDQIMKIKRNPVGEAVYEK